MAFNRVFLEFMIDLTADQLRAGPTFVPAPGVGKALRLLTATTLPAHGSIPFAAGAINVKYDGTDINLLAGDLGIAKASGSVNGLSPQIQNSATTTLTQADIENKALVLRSSNDFQEGRIATLSIANGGADYDVGDTVFLESLFAGAGVLTVSSVTGGAVTGLTLPANGYGAIVGNDQPTTTATGEGSGLIVNVLTITLANTTVRAWFVAEELLLP